MVHVCVVRLVYYVVYVCECVLLYGMVSVVCVYVCECVLLYGVVSVVCV